MQNFDNASLAEFRTLFATEICDRRTDEFLRHPTLTEHFSALIDARRPGEIELLRSLLDHGRGPNTDWHGQRIVLGNVALAEFGGSELWTLDVARFIHAFGLDIIVHSPKLGRVAELVRESGIAVTSTVDDLIDFDPTIIHLNHFEAAREVIDAFAGRARIVNTVHGLLPRPGLPGYADVDRYCSVSIHAKAKVHRLTGTPWHEIEMLPNFFDEARFRGAGGAARSRKALLFSGRAAPDHRQRLAGFVSRFGMDLDHLGYGGMVSATPEEWLPSYDVVFAVGRSAIEALASGAHVVLWDSGIVGPAVTADTFWTCVVSNFSMASTLLPWRFVEEDTCGDWVESQVTVLSEAGRDEVTALTRNHLALKDAGARFLDMLCRDYRLPGGSRSAIVRAE